MKIGNKQFGTVGIVIAVIAAVVVIPGVILWSVNNSVTNSGNTQEAALNAAYLDNQNYLSDCITKIRETAGVTQAEADKFGDILVEAVKGRYSTSDGKTTSAAVDKGAMFSAIVEKYPDLSGLNAAFERVYTIATGCRTDYRNKQSNLLDRLRNYDTWRTGTWKVRTFGSEFPSSNLVARIGNSTPARGQDALDKMYQIVVVKDSNDAYTSGTLTPETPFAPKK